MASVITRLSVSNDTGTPAAPNGDGTLINAALLTLLQDNIDALLTVGGSGAPGVLTIGADLKVEGFGTHDFSAGGTGGNVLQVRNSSAGTTNYSALHLGNDGSASAAVLSMYSTTFTTAAPAIQDGFAIACGRAGGIAFSAGHASGVIRLYTASSERVRVAADGHVEFLADYGSVNATMFGRAIQTIRSGTNTAQHIAMVRQGARAWSIGFVYNSSSFAIGASQATDSDFSSTAAALTISTADEVQAPNQPGFLAYNAASDTGITAGTVRTVEFDTEQYDDSGDFNNTTDTFTAPVTGRYVLAAGVYIINQDGTARSFSVRFARSGGGDYYFGAESVPGTGGKLFTGSIVLDLAASDTVSVEVIPGAGGGSINYDIGSISGSDPLTWFSGRLMV